MPINWEEAPEDATHHIARQGKSYWIKVTGPDSYEHCLTDGGRKKWQYGTAGQSLDALVEKWGYICVERPRVEEKKMFTVKDVRDTEAYAQLRACVEASVDDVKKRPSALGRLTRRLLYNLNNRGRGWGLAPGDDFEVSNAFDWEATPEGRGFWLKVCNGTRIDNLDPVPLPPLAKAVGKAEVKAAQKVPAPPKRLGWWAN